MGRKAKAFRIDPDVAAIVETWDYGDFTRNVNEAIRRIWGKKPLAGELPPKGDNGGEGKTGDDHVDSASSVFPGREAAQPGSGGTPKGEENGESLRGSAQALPEESSPGSEDTPDPPVSASEASEAARDFQGRELLDSPISPGSNPEDTTTKPLPPGSEPSTVSSRPGGGTSTTSTPRSSDAYLRRPRTGG